MMPAPFSPWAIAARAARLCAAWALACQAGLAWPAGLLDYYDKALQRDPDYAAARANFDTEVRYRDLAAGAFLPSLNLTASHERNNYQRRDLDSSISSVVAGQNQTEKFRYDSTVLGLRLTQPLYNKDRQGLQREYTARANRAEPVLAQARQELATRLVQTVFNYLLNLDQLALAQAQVVALQAQLSQLEGLLVSRSSTRTEVADARARMELAQVQVSAAQSQLEARKLEFVRLTGEPPGPELKPLADNPQLQEPQPLEPQAWIDAARERSYRVLAQQGALQLAEAALERSRAALHPTVNLVAGVQQSRNPNYFSSAERTGNLGVELSYNLFDGGAARVQVEQALSQVQRARHELEAAQYMAAAETGQAYWGVVNGIKQIRATEQAVAAAELALQGARLGIKASIRTYADELNAVQLLYTARRDLQRERYTYLVSRAQLLWSAGLASEALATLLQGMLP